jgi:protein gp37
MSWARSRMVFVNSMSDLFHEEVPDEFIVAVCRVMAAANWHTYQVLTKRAERMRNLLSGHLSFVAESDHVWWGVSVENRLHGLPRIQHLRESRARIRFLSVEPLLEWLGPIDLAGIDWVIVGGESGPGARKMDPEWVRDLRDQCKEWEVPFFFKQWGGVQKGKHGRFLDGQTYDEFPVRPPKVMPSKAERDDLARKLTWNPAGLVSCQELRKSPEILLRHSSKLALW